MAECPLLSLATHSASIYEMCLVFVGSGTSLPFLRRRRLSTKSVVHSNGAGVRFAAPLGARTHSPGAFQLQYFPLNFQKCQSAVLK